MLPPTSVNQRFPSRAVVIPSGPVTSAGTGKAVNAGPPDASAAGLAATTVTTAAVPAAHRRNVILPFPDTCRRKSWHGVIPPSRPVRPYDARTLSTGRAPP